MAKLTYPVANIGGRGIAQLQPFVRFMTKHNSICLGIDNAFGHMELCFVLPAEEMFQ